MNAAVTSARLWQSRPGMVGRRLAVAVVTVTSMFAQEAPLVERVRAATTQMRAALAAGQQRVAPEVLTSLVPTSGSGAASPDLVPALVELVSLARLLNLAAPALACLDFAVTQSGAGLADDVADAMVALRVDCLLRLGRVEAAATTLQSLVVQTLDRDPESDPVGHEVLRQVAAVRYAERQFQVAEPLQARVVAIARQQRDPWRLRADLDQAGRCRHRLGDRRGAFEAFRESLALAAALPADSPAVLSAKFNLGSAQAALGDYRGAYELVRDVLAVRERDLPPGDPLTVQTQMALSQALVQLDDLGTARELQARALAAMERQPDRYGDLLAQGRLYQARILYSLEDFAAAYELAVAVVADFEAGRAGHDRDLNLAKTLLGGLEWRRNQLGRARELLEAALVGLQHTLPFAHNDTQIAAAELITVCRLQGDVERAVDLAQQLLDAARSSLRDHPLSARQTASLARIQDLGLDHALSLCGAGVPPQVEQDLLRRALEVSQALRGCSMRVVRRAHGRRAESPRIAALASEIERIAERLQAAVVTGDRQELAALVHQRDVAEIALVQAARESGDPAAEWPTIAALAAALPARSAAAAIVGFSRCELGSGDPAATKARPWLVALVMRSDGIVRMVDLGPRAAMLDRIDDFRAATRKSLRRFGLDPVLAAAGDIDTLWLALDEAWELVPWDALPAANGEPVGASVAIRRLPSLLELVSAPPTPAGPPVLVAVGDVDYGPVTPSLPLLATAAVAAPTMASLRKSDGSFPPLVGSRDEIDAVERALRDRFDGLVVRRLVGGNATKGELARAVAGASFLHVATHGFVATERSLAPGRSPGGALIDAAFALTPLSLCGLALAGANGGHDARGSAAGLLTGAELQHLDLRACQLAVLSCCDSGLGANSDGQGLASLCWSLHAAGARYVVATLGPVEDHAATVVMAAFYRELAAAPDQPERALWRARMAARAKGVPFRDWASYQISGR